jgi:hypothetical protein
MTSTPFAIASRVSLICSSGSPIDVRSTIEPPAARSESTYRRSCSESSLAKCHEQRIVDEGAIALAVRDRHVERRLVTAAEKIRQIRRR